MFLPIMSTVVAIPDIEFSLRGVERDESKFSTRMPILAVMMSVGILGLASEITTNLHYDMLSRTPPEIPAKR